MRLADVKMLGVAAAWKAGQTQTHVADEAG